MRTLYVNSNPHVAVHFVGRRYELGLLHAVLAELEERSGSSVFIGGEAGLGKSRLLEHFAGVANGFHVIHISCERLAIDGTTLNEAILAQLEPASRRRGVVVLIDDLHLAGAHDIATLGHFMRASSDTRVAVAATFLENAGRAPASLLRQIARWDSGGAVRHTLPPLEEEAIELIVRSAAVTVSKSVERAEITEIVRASAGSPRYALELLDERLRGGSATNVPPSARAAAEELSSSLPAHTIRLMRIAALIDRRFCDTWLLSISREPEEIVADALQLAVERGVLVEDQSAPGHFAFWDDALRHALSAQFVSSKRKILHARIAETLAAAGGEEVHAPLIARHWDEAQNRVLAARWLPRAARYLASKNDLNGAAHLFLRALPHVPQGSEEWLSLHADAAGCLEELGRHESAIPIREAMLKHSDELGDEALSAPVLLALMTDYWWTGRFAESEATVERLESLRSPQLTGVIVSAITSLARIVFASGYPARAKALLSRTDSALIPDADNKAKFLVSQALIESQTVSPDVTLRRLADVTDMAAALSDARSAAGMMFTAACVASGVGSIRAAQEYAARALEHSQRIDTASRFKLWSILITLEIRILAGDLHGLDELVPLLLAARESGTIYESHAAAHAVALGMRIGDPVLVESFFNPSHLRAAIARRDVELCGLLLNAFCDVMASRGMLAELTAMIEQCVAADMVDPYFTVQLSAAQFGSVDHWQTAREQIARHERFTSGALARAAGPLFDALIERRRRKNAAAIRSARAAATEYGKLGCRLMEARALELAGDTEFARELYVRAGALRDAARLAANQTRKARRAAFALALTPREREVITLISMRKTNKQIADALRISERTVHHHVEAIFSKLGVRARWQITPELIAAIK